MKIKSQLKRIITIILDLLCYSEARARAGDVVLIGLLFSVLFFSFQPVSASLLDELDSQITNTETKIQNAEKKVGDYKKKISKAKDDITSLKQQINLMEIEIQEILAQTDLTQAEIEQTNLKILKKIEQIDRKIQEIIHQKEILGEIIRNIHDHDNRGHLETLLSTDNFSALFNEIRYADLIQDQVQNMLKSLQTLKLLLDQEKQNLETRKQEQEKLKTRLIREQATLKTRKKSKTTLLAKTNSQEKQYQKLLAQIQEQKQTLAYDLNKLSQEKQEELARVKALQSKPGSGLASEAWHFYQTDPKWKNTTIGISRSTVGDVGCALTALSMVFKYYGIETDPGKIAKQADFAWNLIYWPKKWQYLDLVMNRSRKPVDWQRIDQELANNNPVIVFIKVGKGKRKGHYVVIHGKDNNGKYIVHDPYYGSNIYLDSTIELLETAYNTNTSIVDQMIIYH
ncbi:hypothetical protein CL633_00170 [bacterium]|nr:hypothetical protein [bacterium]|tara:strand:+ start:7181 stop:8545 length:1365 start_codon:yes stop_codon:yes gene_type:complete